MVKFIIPAKGASEGILNKNQKRILEYSLVEWSIKCALDSGLGEVFVSTDNIEIADEAKRFGAGVIERPHLLCAPDVHSIHVILHAIDYRHINDKDIVFMLLPTSPFRKAGSLIRMFGMLNRGDYYDSTISVVGAIQTCPHHSLRFIDGEGYLDPLETYNLNQQRQDVDPLFKVAGGMYAATSGFIKKHQSFHTERNTKACLIDNIEALDINTQDDLDFARMIAYGRRMIS